MLPNRQPPVLAERAGNLGPIHNLANFRLYNPVTDPFCAEPRRIYPAIDNLANVPLLMAPTPFPNVPNSAPLSEAENEDLGYGRFKLQFAIEKARVQHNAAGMHQIPPRVERFRIEPYRPPPHINQTENELRRPPPHIDRIEPEHYRPATRNDRVEAEHYQVPPPLHLDRTIKTEHDPLPPHIDRIEPERYRPAARNDRVEAEHYQVPPPLHLDRIIKTEHDPLPPPLAQIEAQTRDLSDHLAAMNSGIGSLLSHLDRLNVESRHTLDRLESYRYEYREREIRAQNQARVLEQQQGEGTGSSAATAAAATAASGENKDRTKSEGGVAEALLSLWSQR